MPRLRRIAASALYQKFGFTTAGIRKRYYSDTGEDALILWRGGLQEAEFINELKTWQRANAIAHCHNYRLPVKSTLVAACARI